MTVLVAVVAAGTGHPAGHRRRQRPAGGIHLEPRGRHARGRVGDVVRADVRLAEDRAGDGRGTGARVVVVDKECNLIADSDNSSLDRLVRPARDQQALAGSLASDVRYSATIGGDLRYVAAPVVQNYQAKAAVRLSLPEASVNEQVRQTVRWLMMFVVSVVLTAALVAWLLARSIASPLRRLARVAAELPEDLDLRADEGHGPARCVRVARALNSTAGRLSGILQRTQRVAADASHHLRTPFTGVRLRLEAIEDISDDGRVQAEARAATCRGRSAHAPHRPGAGAVAQ